MEIEVGEIYIDKYKELYILTEVRDEGVNLTKISDTWKSFVKYEDLKEQYKLLGTRELALAAFVNTLEIDEDLLTFKKQLRGIY